MASLRHPIFWCSLVVLVANDHVLKHAAVLPGAITGKLSDVAGLIVAPVLAAALLRARISRTRALAFALPTVPFVAINVSPLAAAAVEASMGALGVPWTIWTDPTDLVALAVLPIAWHVAAAEGSRVSMRALERAGLIAGSLACVATSAPEPPDTTVPSYNASAWLSNRTGEELDVRIRWIDADFSCSGIAADPARALSPDLFGDAITFRLAADENVPIDRGAAASAAGLPAPTRTVTECDVALVQADGLPSTVAYVSGLFPQQVAATGDVVGSTLGQVVIRAAEAGLELGSSGVALSPAIDRAEPSGCFEPGAQTFEYSIAGLPELGTYRLEDKNVLADGCIVASLADDLDGTPHGAFLCIPEWAFPFEVGDRLHIAHDPIYGEGLSITREHADGTFGAGIQIRDVGASLLLGEVRGTLLATGCGADRVSCGGYVAAASMEIETPSETLFVQPGEVVDLGTIDGRPTSLALGHAEEVLVTRVGCEAGRATLGLQADVILIYEEVVR